MSSVYSSDCGITSWGIRNGKQIWRVTWKERRNMVADVTGPYDLIEAFTKLTPEVLARLPWTDRDE